MNATIFIIGGLSAVVGIAFIYIPAALIVTGFGLMYLACRLEKAMMAAPEPEVA